MRLRRGHAIFIHKLLLKYVFQLSSFAPEPTLAHGCQLSPRGCPPRRAPARSAQPRCPFVGVFCEPYSSFGTVIQSSTKSFSLSNTPSPISSRLRECRAYFVVGDPPSQGFHQTWVMILGVSVFERGFRLQATKLSTYEHFSR